MASRTVNGDLSLRPGRNGDDSSSSRESSPGPAFRGKRKRSFSPGSVDGSPEPAEPFVNDETPQPEDRPLIRQAVAFGGMTSSFSLPTSSTYTATLSAATAGKPQFLPGQVVKKPRRKKKDDAPYKKQSGRFRLEAYNPGTPSELLPGPMIQQGPGPYASAFRGYTDPRSARSESPAVTATSTLASHSERSASPVPTRGSANKRATTNGTTSKTTSQSRSRTQARTSSHIPAQMHSGASHPVMDLFTGTTHDMAASPSNSRSSYYRLDYETGRSLQANSASASATMPMDTSLDFPMMPPAEPAQPMQGVVQASTSYINPSSPNLAPPSSPNRSQPRNAEVSSAPRPPAPSGRMVTILAQDIRSGEPDHLLVEVKVPIRPADDPADGYWADAKDLVEQWQGGPARIDGPARVYSLRGKYRQILLRVTSLNEDRYTSSNVVIKRDRIIEVVIENLPEVGAPPPRPQIPPELRQDVEMTPASNYASVVSQPVAKLSTPGRFTGQPGPPPVAHGHGLNQHSAPTPTNHKVPSLPRSSPRSPPREFTHRRSNSPTPGEPLAQPAAATSVSNSGTATTPTAQNDTPITGPSLPDLHPQYRPENIAAVRRTNKGYDSPGPEDEPEQVDQAIIKLLSVLIPKADRRKFTEFFSKASLETASNMVFRYRYVKELIDKYAGQPAPFKSSSDYIVEERHIINALKIEDSDGRYASNCQETLRLLQLYGQDGECFEDSEVLKLMAETEVAYNAKPVKRLLRLLRDIDTGYTERRGTP